MSVALYLSHAVLSVESGWLSVGVDAGLAGARHPERLHLDNTKVSDPKPRSAAPHDTASPLTQARPVHRNTLDALCGRSATMMDKNSSAAWNDVLQCTKDDLRLAKADATTSMKPNAGSAMQSRPSITVNCIGHRRTPLARTCRRQDRRDVSRRRNGFQHFAEKAWF